MRNRKQNIRERDSSRIQPCPLDIYSLKIFQFAVLCFFVNPLLIGYTICLYCFHYIIHIITRDVRASVLTQKLWKICFISRLTINTTGIPKFPKNIIKALYPDNCYERVDV